MKQLQIFPLAEHKRTPRALRRHNSGLCCTPRCRNSHRTGGWFCSSCVEREYRWKDPVRAVWRDHKQNAIKRGIGWFIDLDPFRIWITSQIGFMEKRGNFADAWTIDRKDSDKTYTLDNIQVMTRRVNAYKEQYRRKYGNAAAIDAFNGITVDTLTGEIEEVRRHLPVFEPVAPDDKPPF